MYAAITLVGFCITWGIDALCTAPFIANHSDNRTRYEKAQILRSRFSQMRISSKYVTGDECVRGLMFVAIVLQVYFSRQGYWLAGCTIPQFLAWSYSFVREMLIHDTPSEQLESRVYAMVDGVWRYDVWPPSMPTRQTQIALLVAIVLVHLRIWLPQKLVECVAALFVVAAHCVLAFRGVVAKRYVELLLLDGMHAMC